MPASLFNPAPLLEASLFVQVHVVSATAAFIFGALVLFARKGDARHKLAGRVWVVLMLATALSSFGISDNPVLFGFGPIHVLSVLTLVGLTQAVLAARAGQIVAHQKGMRSLYFFALIAAGLFTFLPGRRMHEVFLANVPLVGDLGAAPMATMFAAALLAMFALLRRTGKV
ncbi:MAG: DUF2306 domain-containing protein [Rhizobiaceae bacterium]|nr:DUF2306 domain-containing protein [Rhizobiaceae bacterium]